MKTEDIYPYLIHHRTNIKLRSSTLCHHPPSVVSQRYTSTLGVYRDHGNAWWGLLCSLCSVFAYKFIPLQVPLAHINKPKVLSLAKVIIQLSLPTGLWMQLLREEGYSKALLKSAWETEADTRQESIQGTSWRGIGYSRVTFVRVGDSLRIWALYMYMSDSVIIPKSIVSTPETALCELPLI
jgi:hypothetical protein